MARRRAKKTVNGAVETEAQIEKEQAAFTDQEGFIYLFIYLSNTWKKW